MNRFISSHIVPATIACALLLLTGFFAAGCSTASRSAPPEVRPEVNSDRIIPEVLTVPVAVVKSVYHKDQFVVIEFNQRQPPKPGDELVVMRGNQKVAKVRITAPTRGAYVTADILDGTVQVGDIVP
jgi:hypothetical protein